MQAVTFEQLGGPEALRLREIDEPQLRANQVLVRVQAVAVDHVLFADLGEEGEHRSRRADRPRRDGIDAEDHRQRHQLHQRQARSGASRSRCRSH